MRRLTSEEIQAKFGLSQVQKAQNQERARVAAEARQLEDHQRRVRAKRRAAARIQRKENQRVIHALHNSANVSNSLEDQIRGLRGVRGTDGRFLKTKGI